MTNATVSMDVRVVDPSTSIVDIAGDITAACEDTLMDAYAQASGEVVSVLAR